MGKLIKHDNGAINFVGDNAPGDGNLWYEITRPDGPSRNLKSNEHIYLLLRQTKPLIMGRQPESIRHE